MAIIRHTSSGNVCCLHARRLCISATHKNYKNLSASSSLNPQIRNVSPSSNSFATTRSSLLMATFRYDNLQYFVNCLKSRCHVCRLGILSSWWLWGSVRWEYCNQSIVCIIGCARQEERQYLRPTDIFSTSRDWRNHVHFNPHCNSLFASASFEICKYNSMWHNCIMC